MSAKQQTGKGNRFLKTLWPITIVAPGYIGYMNLLPSGGTLTYLINVGGEDIAGQARVTGPFDRISDKMMVNGTNFRKLKKNGVYFELDDKKDRGKSRQTCRGKEGMLGEMCRSYFKFFVGHKRAFQQISIKGDDFHTEIDVNKAKTWFNIALLR